MTKPSILFNDWVRLLRKQSGRTRQQVAQSSGGQISQQYVHFIETGKAVNIGSDKLKALAKGLGVPVEVLEPVLFGRGLPEIPVLGRVAGGPEVQSLAEDYQAESISYPHPEAGLFSFEMMGDSMAPRIEHGDLVLVRPCQPDEEILSGWIYVLRQGRKLTCKYVVADSTDERLYWLKAENSYLFENVHLDAGYELVGRVIEVRKTLNLSCPVL